MDPWASPWAEEEGAQGASTAPPVAPLSSTPPPPPSVPLPPTTSDAEVDDPWASDAVSTQAQDHPRVDPTTTSPPAAAQNERDTTTPWPDVSNDSTTDPWAEQRDPGASAAISNDDDGRWQPSSNALSQDGISSSWHPTDSTAAHVLSSTQPTNDDVVEEGVDPWAATPYTGATTQSHNTTSPFQSTRLRNLDQSLADPPKPADADKVTPTTTVPSSTPSTTTQAQAKGDADSGPGWEMKKKQGAAALADRLGGWMRSTVTTKNADPSATTGQPQVASAADEDEEEEEEGKQESMPNQSQPPARSDLFNDPIPEQPQQPQPQQQQQGAMGRFLNRWRKPASDATAQANNTNDGSIVDGDGLDWLGSQGSQNTVTQVVDPQDDFLAESPMPAVAPPPSRTSRPRTSFPVSSTGRGVQQAPAPIASLSRFAPPQQQASNDPFDFSAFEEATPTMTATRAPTSYPRPLTKPATPSRPVVPPIRSTAIESDAFEVLNRASSSRGPAEERTSQLPRPAQLPPPSFYSGRAQEDDFERSGYDYREEDESADDWGWGVEQPAATKYDDEFASQDSIIKRPAAPVPPPKQQPQPEKPSAGSTMLLNRAASLSSAAPLSRVASSSSSSGGGTSSKRGSLLPPPPPGRNRVVQLGSEGTGAGAGAGLNRSLSVTAGRSQSSSQNSSCASSPAIAPQSLPPQHQRQRPTSSLSKSEAGGGGGMTSDDLAFFEGL